MVVRSSRRLSVMAFALLLAGIGIVSFYPRLAHAQSRTHTYSFSYPPLGVIGGQTVRVSIASPREEPPDPCVLIVYNAAGQVVAQSSTFQLPAVQNTAFFDFPYSALGAPATNAARLEVRAVLQIQSTKQYPPDPCASLELVDQSSGGTLVYLPPGALQLPAVQ